MTETYQVGHNLVPTDIITSPIIRGTDIANITGDPSDCGMPDVQGNIGYFNNLCVPFINGNSANGASSGLSAATFQVGGVPGTANVSVNLTMYPQNSAGEQFYSLDQNQSTIIITISGLYLFTLSVSWDLYYGIASASMYSIGLYSPNAWGYWAQGFPINTMSYNPNARLVELISVPSDGMTTIYTIPAIQNANTGGSLFGYLGITQIAKYPPDYQPNIQDITPSHDAPRE